MLTQDNVHKSMKKIIQTITSIVFILTLILWSSPVLASPVIIDSYNTPDNVDGFGAISCQEYAQSFTSSNYYTLSSAKIGLKWATAAPTGGTVTFEIYAHSGVYGVSSVPTGSALAVSAPLDLTTITNTATLYELSFTGANAITLNPQYYELVPHFQNFTGTGSVYVSMDNIGGTASGNKATRGNICTTWTANSTQEMNFYVYGDLTSPPSSISSHLSLSSGSLKIKSGSLKIQ